MEERLLRLAGYGEEGRSESGGTYLTNIGTNNQVLKVGNSLIKVDLDSKSLTEDQFFARYKSKGLNYLISVKNVDWILDHLDNQRNKVGNSLGNKNKFSGKSIRWNLAAYNQPSKGEDLVYGFNTDNINYPKLTKERVPGGFYNIYQKINRDFMSAREIGRLVTKDSPSRAVKVAGSIGQDFLPYVGKVWKGVSKIHYLDSKKGERYKYTFIEMESREARLAEVKPSGNLGNIMNSTDRAKLYLSNLNDKINLIYATDFDTPQSNLTDFKATKRNSNPSKTKNKLGSITEYDLDIENHESHIEVKIDPIYDTVMSYSLEYVDKGETYYISDKLVFPKLIGTKPYLQFFPAGSAGASPLYIKLMVYPSTNLILVSLSKSTTIVGENSNLRFKTFNVVQRNGI